MASRLVLSALFALAVSLSLAEAASHHHGSAAAPAPGAAVDCSSLVLNMADCLSYVSNGSTTTKPEGTCCSGLKTVLKTDAECLCEAFKSSAQLGVVLNVSKALTLPAACKLNAPSASNCGLSLAAPAAPAGAPVSSSSGIAGAPTASTGANQLAPAPTPGASGSRSLAISFGLLVIGLVLASVPGF